MTQLLLSLVQRDPVLVVAIMIIVVLVVYIEIMHLRILFITRTLDSAFNIIRNENGNEGSSCLETFVMLIVVVLLTLTFLIAISRL